MGTTMALGLLLARAPCLAALLVGRVDVVVGGSHRVRVAGHANVVVGVEQRKRLLVGLVRKLGEKLFARAQGGQG